MVKKWLKWLNGYKMKKSQKIVLKQAIHIVFKS